MTQEQLKKSMTAIFEEQKLLKEELADLKKNGLRRSGFWGHAFNLRNSIIGIVAACALTAGILNALITKPYTFVDATPTSAMQVNSNFDILYTAVQQNFPVGTVVAYGGTTAPAGWKLCDGTSLSTTTYADLYAVIGYAYGGSGANFNLPDMRGRFLRGLDGTAARDPNSGTRTASAAGGNTGNNIGSIQTDDYKSHSHSANVSGSGTSTVFASGGGTAYGSAVGSASGGSETRPINIYVNYIIKY
jgi:microcystin-dependent protein